MDGKESFRIRTITGFIQLLADDFNSLSPSSSALTASGSHGTQTLVEYKIANAVQTLRQLESHLVSHGYTVQTIRLAANPFGEWLKTIEKDNQQELDDQLHLLDSTLAQHSIEFFALGPATTEEQVKKICTKIVAHSSRFSCSAEVSSGTNLDMAKAAAKCIITISRMGESLSESSSVSTHHHLRDGLGNFRFCVTAGVHPYTPFFPAAKSRSIYDSMSSSGHKMCIALGLENGILANELLLECGSIVKVPIVLQAGLSKVLEPLQVICDCKCRELDVDFAGIDTSLNPSLSQLGSVAKAMECLTEVSKFGETGTLAGAAAVTTCLQSLSGIKLTGYCGLMLPLCEDLRLVDIANSGGLRVLDLLNICNVCGVGIDTVPIPGNCPLDNLVNLILDVASVAHRWNKSLSCRVFPVPGREAGEMTTFDSPYMVNCRILPI